MTYKEIEESECPLGELDIPSVERAAFNIIYTLQDRGGFDLWWHEIKEEIKEEIFREIQESMAYYL